MGKLRIKRLLAMLAVLSCACCLTACQGNCDDEEEYDAKPVIYLYPESKTDVTVKLDYAGELTCTYPAYQDGWNVSASPDGTLTDADGQTYNYLFLENALSKLGLTRREANEFMVYWLPLMQDNPYNLIAFQSDVYTQNAQLLIDPAPDTLLRVFMAWKSVGEAVEIPAQNLSAPERIGFTVVEWGGCQVR